MTLRVGVVSDSHGALGALDGVLMRMEAAARIDCLVHLGDGYRDLDRYLDAFPRVIRVRGNCDGSSGEETAETLGGATVFMTHGHAYQVRLTTAPLASRAREIGARAALFGHTHKPFCDNRGAVLLLNPGAAMDGRFAILTVFDTGAVDARLY